MPDQEKIRRKQTILEWIAEKLFPEPISSGARESKKARKRMEGEFDIEEVPKAEGKSTGENRDIPRQKFYK